MGSDPRVVDIKRKQTLWHKTLTIGYILMDINFIKQAFMKGYYVYTSSNLALDN